MSAVASASAIVADTASGFHHLKIAGYSSLKGLPNGHRLSSCPFTVGGHHWRIDYYPNGDRQESAGYVFVFLVLDENMIDGVKAQFEFGFWPKKRGLFFRKRTKSGLRLRYLFSQSTPSWGYGEFMKWEALDRSEHLKDDSFTIRCDIVVLNKVCIQGRAKKAAPKFVSVPPSDLNKHLGSLLVSEKGADVLFEVGGETFAAHRCMLAARSLVFSAELFGSMKEGDINDLVRIDDMEAQVFKALLCFVYTGSLPEMKEEDDEEAMYHHLLVTADKYNMERLKLICEEKLCKYIDVGTVVNILALAEPHHCHGLKSAWFDFLSSPTNLRTAMASDGFEHLAITCPSVVKDLIAMCSAT
ncbi:BTB/POZ and MATH domain-containing protein 1 [Brachypodium distachyon]|uniref:BTB domain-containing protein n=1 Tax=Brachypodium distachyon TaxID=15368 RepID=I1I446_BRADI|nr:BTB/POZ and MATH domain-containing protein 1 [Brachypodium distachyon]KQJ96779.1 hypothetical protein BRADI_3g27074v3 [Brachypodium distachyon]|eukprot:XP_014755988.1 BTB/POZ and MATH domain-containing protein 1 [Brachypodium distachyon]